MFGLPSLQSMGIAFVAGLLLSGIGVGYAVHHWDANAYLILQNKYDTAKANEAQVSTGLDTCNAGVKAQAAASAKALAIKQGLIDAAQAGQIAAEKQASDLLHRKPPPGMDVCKAALALIKEQVQ